MTNIDDEVFKRLVLMNQYTILAKVDSEQQAMWERAAEQVRDHHPIDDLPAVDWLIESSRDPFTEQDRDLVYDVFQMYDDLQRAENDGVVKPSRPANFPGYDGNNETKYMSYARSLVKDQGKWTYLRLAAKDFNAHCPTLEVYDRMLTEWRKVSRSADMTAAEYEAIINARIHPSNRP